MLVIPLFLFLPIEIELNSKIKCLFFSEAGAVVQGDILLNGRRVGPFMHRMSGFVHQDDLFIGTITVLEHITFMVKKSLIAL